MWNKGLGLQCLDFGVLSVEPRHSKGLGFAARV